MKGGGPYLSAGVGRYYRTLAPNNPHVRYWESERHREHCRFCAQSPRVDLVPVGRRRAKRIRGERLRAIEALLRAPAVKRHRLAQLAARVRPFRDLVSRIAWAILELITRPVVFLRRSA